MCHVTTTLTLPTTANAVTFIKAPFTTHERALGCDVRCDTCHIITATVQPACGSVEVERSQGHWVQEVVVLAKEDVGDVM